MEYRILVPNHGLNPHPLHWKCGVLTTGTPGMSLNLFFFFNFYHRQVPSVPGWHWSSWAAAWTGFWARGLSRLPQAIQQFSWAPHYKWLNGGGRGDPSLLVTWVALPVSCRISYLGTWAMQPTIRCPLARHSCQCKQPTMNWSPVCD